ncbi:uncharacterized protein Spn85F isoform X2 [Linepithema humile]|uniref:uncharacterized protein Spn85F isoform X2 n=1 Tax=Linepithema humile TaxID=83485 RepID=UPI00351DF7E8
MGRPLHWIIILQLSSVLAYRYDWYRANTQRPVDVVTDVVNDLGVKILQQYSAHGNVAFSPTGIAFVLAALYEGSAGRGRQQIVEIMGLPNRDVTRIGFRDIHRRLRSYLNADGFLGGLTLSKENTRLRPEYEDILRFYGFDLSSIEQEANVTVSMSDSSTKLPMPLPVAPDTTTILTDTATTLFSAGAETTVASSTVTIPANVDLQTTSITSSRIDAQNILPTQSTNFLPAVTSGESAQPPSSTVDPKSVVDSPNTVTPAINTESPPTTAVNSPTNAVTMIDVVDNQNPQTPPTVGVSEAGTNETVANIISNTNAMGNLENTLSNALETSNASIQESMDSGVTMAVVTDASETISMATEVPSTLVSNTELSMTTNTPNLSTTATASVSTEVSMTTSTIISNMILANASTTTNLPISVTPMILNNGNAINSINGTMIDNSIISQPNTEISMSTDTPTGNIPGMTAMNDLTTTPVINVDGNAMLVSSAVRNEDNSAIANSAMNNRTVVNSTINSMTNNETVVASPIDENIVSMNRKKKVAESEAIKSESNLKNIMNDNNESTDGLPSLRKRRSPRGYFSSYPDEGIWMQDLEIWKSYNTLNPGESSDEDSATEISFLVNGCDISSVSASSYIAVLPFAYLPSLHAVALEFPLDDPRYNIILLMPTDKTDTHRLARDLSGKPLRSLRKRLQPTWVRATIPSFMLRGFVTLTSFLQRLGILDVFEPRAADLSPMTSDLGVYARDVQQSIGVNIRNYMKPDRTHSRNGLFERAGPVPFTALHPFLYFIVDTETSVSLIAGRVNDPLNSRIL